MFWGAVTGMTDDAVRFLSGEGDSDKHQPIRNPRCNDITQVTSRPALASPQLPDHTAVTAEYNYLHFSPICISFIHEVV